MRKIVVLGESLLVFKTYNLFNFIPFATENIVNLSFNLLFHAQNAFS